MMRKMHYNEGLNIKLARQLIANELAEDEDEDEEMRDDTEDLREAAEENEEISVDPPQEGEEDGYFVAHFLPACETTGGLSKHVGSIYQP